jgi:ribosome-interacting GTPase 1
MFRSVLVLALIAIANGFAPSSIGGRWMTKSSSSQTSFLSMKLGVDEKVVVIGVAADSGCGKSTFMRRLTKVIITIITINITTTTCYYVLLPL